MATLGRPLLFTSVEELQTKIDSYFKWAEDNKRPFTITGLALHLDCNRETIQTYKDREEFSDTIKRAYERVQNYAEERLFAGGQVAGPIFALKNFGWKDQQNIDHTSKGESIIPILGGSTNAIQGDNSDQEIAETQQKA